MSSTPEHYAGKRDVINQIWHNRGAIPAIDFCFDNINKYATRMTRKGQMRDDLGKIEVYAGRIISMVGTCQPQYGPLVAEIVQKETAIESIEYLRGQFGDLFALDYIQGRIIEYTIDGPMHNSIDDKLKYSLHNAVMIITLTSLYMRYLSEMGPGESLEEELDGEESVMDEETVEEQTDPLINVMSEGIEVVANEIANAFKDVFKRK